MKIAQIAPLFESVPPQAYGGTERVIFYLTEELIRLGHEVTLFASGDSMTAGELVAPVENSIRLTPGDQTWLIHHTIQMENLRQRAAEFDVIHYHIDYLHFPLARQLRVPHVTTLHGRLDLPGLDLLYQRFQDSPLVSASHSQRTPQPHVNWVGTVHHGLPPDLYTFAAEAGDYFAFVGRVSPEKRLDRAIEIAERCGVPIHIGAKLDVADAPYFNTVIKPLLRRPGVRFLGEVGQKEKQELLEHAKALLFPIDWPEPFGLVMIEALSCGTPVVAYRNGAVPEILEDGVTGFIVDNQDDAVRAALRIDTIERRNCRAAFERRFTANRMATDYLRIYEQRIGSWAF
jgi:glycosyltransferase involved in cell wall biosynthesis